MFGVILKATKSSFPSGMPFCRSIYVKKVMKLLAFIFEQPSYIYFIIKKLLTYVSVDWHGVLLNSKGNHIDLRSASVNITFTVQ